MNGGGALYIISCDDSQRTHEYVCCNLEAVQAFADFIRPYRQTLSLAVYRNGIQVDPYTGRGLTTEELENE